MTDHMPYRIFLAILLAAGLSMSLHFRGRSARAGGRLEGRPEGLSMFLGLRGSALAGQLAVCAFLVSPRWLAWSFIDLPDWPRWAGATIAVGGYIGIIWMMRHLGTNLTRSVGTRPHHTLVTSGPYRWIRHPLYSFGFLAFAGISLMTTNWFVALCYGIAFALIAARTRIEEANLLDRFGSEYRHYMQRTGRYLPVLHR